MPRYFDKGPDASAALVCQAAANGGCKPRDGGVCGDVELGGERVTAVELVVEREREIRAFTPEEYWELHADTHNAANAADAIRMQVARYRGENFRPNNGDDAEKHRAALVAAGKLPISQREERPTRSKAPPPFITSTLQQAASTRLGFGVKKTMMMAQRLYEAGYITYMRTDSTNLSDEAVSACRNLIKKDFAPEYLPAEPIRYGSREGAQEAHEAIRPSDVTLRSSLLSGMEPDAERLYDLIWRQQFENLSQSTRVRLTKKLKRI